ncbi:MAG TPA: heavy-metal-associated domain-containing protein [Bacteroidales bacterium]|nr:heavy-metal-associated domain-containing protein [Bacteroidales bacterium]
MKTSIKSGLILLISLLGTVIKADAQQPPKIKEVKILTNLHCTSCKAKIENYMAFEKGVVAVGADVETKVVTLSYRTSRTDAEALAEAIRKLGYTAEILPEDEKTLDKGKDKSNQK